jgi:hypothetical protein
MHAERNINVDPRAADGGGPMTPDVAAAFAGDWTLELVLVTRAHVPVLGDFLARSRSELAVRLDTGAGIGVQTQRVCSTTVNEGRGIVRTEIPPAFIAALPVVSFPVDLAARDGAWSYAADFGRQVLGWDGLGAIPSDPLDPRVRDDDGDGHPGLTVRVEAPLVGAGAVYVVQAGRTTVSGTWDGTAFAGAVDIPELAQSVIGASTRMLANGPTVHAAADLSSFRMTRGVASCGPIPGTPHPRPSG